MSARGSLLVAGLLSAALHTGDARGGDPALAEALFQQGKALEQEGKSAEACAKFEASMQAEPSGGAALAYGRCRQLQGKTATAWAEYMRAAMLFKLRGDPKREAFAREQADALQPTLSKLTIEVGAADIEVRRDDVPVAAGAFGVAVPVDPGEHVVTASAPGYETWTGRVSVGPDGAVATLQVPPLKKRPEGLDAAAGDGNVGLVIAGTVLASVGAGALLAGVVLGGVVLSDAGDAEDDPALCGNAGKICTAKGYEQIESARDKAVASNILLGVGATAAVAGGVMLTLALLLDDAPSATVEPVEGGLLVHFGRAF